MHRKNARNYLLLHQSLAHQQMQCAIVHLPVCNHETKCLLTGLLTFKSIMLFENREMCSQFSFFSSLTSNNYKDLALKVIFAEFFLLSNFAN